MPSMTTCPAVNPNPASVEIFSLRSIIEGKFTIDEKKKKGMEDTHKPHRAPHSGTKADKKKAKNDGGSVRKGSNPRAFTMSGSRKAEKVARRSAEVSVYSPLVGVYTNHLNV